MWCSGSHLHGAALPAVLVLCAASILAAGTAAPALANAAPESALLIHVQEPGGSCATAVTYCTDIVRNTSAEGTLEFVIFFSRMHSWEGQDLTLYQVHAELVWPETWEYLDGEQCVTGAALPAPGDHSMQLDLDWSWWCPPLPAQHDEVFPIARLVMNVTGPGRLDFANQSSNPVHLGCWDDYFVSYAAGVDAEAGMDCEYTLMDCGGNEACIASFTPERLELAAPPGAAAWGQVEVRAWGYSGQSCDLVVDPRADWAWAEVLYGHSEHFDSLRVRADATGLAPGVYETQIQVAAPLTHIARCLPVVFTVAESAATPDRDGPTIRVASWGTIKARYGINRP